MTPHAALSAITRPQRVATAARRKQLEAEIAEIIRDEGWSHEAAAHRLAVAKRDITRIMAGRASRLSIADLTALRTWWEDSA